jgi:D-cysteine desulfhydrase
MPAKEIELIVPSPVRRLIASPTHELWLKDDSLVCKAYGGNKPRKLIHLLDDARRRGARRLVTVGAVGSHHVLATGLLGKSIGLPTTAIALPRPYSQHAEQTAQHTLEAGVELIALGSPWDVGQLATRLVRRGDYWIPPGGSSGLGAIGYLEATRELKRQILEQRIPEPDIIVVALGSGGTAAGLLAGLASTGLRSHLVAVSVLRLPMAKTLIESMARAALRRNHSPFSPDFSGILTIESEWIGKGYGHATAAGELAMAEAACFGLVLEATYTGKAFASALAWLRGSSGRGNVSVRRGLRAVDPTEPHRILFWSTFSAVSLPTTTDSAVTLPPAISRLFRSS